MVQVRNNKLTTSATTKKESDSDIDVAPLDFVAINQDFKSKVPRVSEEQLTIFSSVAQKGDVHGCHDTSDSDLCVYYYSRAKKADDICSHISNPNQILSCYNDLVLIDIQSEFEKCNAEKFIDAKVDCFNRIYWAIEITDLCSIFQKDDIYQACVDSVNIRTATSQSNKLLCSSINKKDIRDFCESIFVVGDFDKDGLTDLEENNMRTNPYKVDTDGDTFSDSAEVSDGYNPCGDGKLPAPELLLELCAQFAN